MKLPFARVALVLASSILALPSAAAPPELVIVRPAGNAPDAAGNCYGPPCGSVATVYRIGKYEVTNAQYAAFLNAVADADPNALYHSSMASDARGGITRSGSSGSYSYAVKGGHANKPVVFVSYWDALRYANWLHNGEPNGAQGNSTTENGAYTITSGGVSNNSITRNAGARFYLPSDAEWYKAAYWERSSSTWWDYPVQTDVQPTSSAPPGNATSANYWSGTYALTGSGSFDNGFDYLSDAGAYTTAASDFGTYDQAGNAIEWVESLGQVATTRTQRGGGWDDANALMSASVPIHNAPSSESYDVGFRIAAPEPTAALVSATALLALAGLRRA
jgi:formylglycine-generating enzyme required for sulfatase activity